MRPCGYSGGYKRRSKTAQRCKPLGGRRHRGAEDESWPEDIELEIPAQVALVNMRDGKVGIDIWRRDTGEVLYVEVPNDQPSHSDTWFAVQVDDGAPPHA